MEKLLNKLIEKGWKPFGRKYKDVCREPNEWHSYMFDHDVYYRREIASKESWLWQFVCENGMIKNGTYTRWENWNTVLEKNYVFYDNQTTYRLIEIALCDEDKLEDFILDNVKIWNED